MSILLNKFFRKKPIIPTADPNHPFMKTTFKKAFLSGKICEDAIMDYVTFWNCLNTGKTIEDFLGMSDNQYLDWVMNAPISLKEILITDY